MLAHPLPDGRAAVLSRDVEQTASALEALGAGDGAAWRRLYGLWENTGPQLLDALFVPFPPVRSGLRLAAKLRGPGMLRFARFALLPVRRLIQEEFTGPGSLLLAGCALHADSDARVHGQLDIRMAADHARSSVRLAGGRGRRRADHRWRCCAG